MIKYIFFITYLSGSPLTIKIASSSVIGGSEFNEGIIVS